MTLPPFVRGVVDNLADEETPDLLLIAAVVLENAREFLVARTTPAAAAALDEVYKPLIRVLIERAMGTRFVTPRGQA